MRVGGYGITNKQKGAGEALVAGRRASPIVTYAFYVMRHAGSIEAGAEKKHVRAEASWI